MYSTRKVNKGIYTQRREEDDSSAAKQRAKHAQQSCQTPQPLGRGPANLSGYYYYYYYDYHYYYYYY